MVGADPTTPQLDTAPPDTEPVVAPAPIVAVASKGYLRRRGTPKTPADLRKHDCIVDTNFRDQHRWRMTGPRGVETVTVTGPFRANSPLVVRDLGHRLVDDAHALVETLVRLDR